MCECEGDAARSEGRYETLYLREKTDGLVSVATRKARAELRILNREALRIERWRHEYGQRSSCSRRAPHFKVIRLTQT